jgi:hypothetical protein
MTVEFRDARCARLLRHKKRPEWPRPNHGSWGASTPQHSRLTTRAHAKCHGGHVTLPAPLQDPAPVSLVSRKTAANWSTQVCKNAPASRS